MFSHVSVRRVSGYEDHKLYALGVYATTDTNETELRARADPGRVYLRPRSAVGKTAPNPLGMGFQYGKIFHIAGM